MKNYLSALLNDTGVVEVRHLPSGQSGRFNDVDKLLMNLDGYQHQGNLYTSLNRPSDQSASNQFKDSALCDKDINRIVRLPFDFDPVRGNEASTEAELQAAKIRAEGLIQRLYVQGFPMPLVAMSGNGYHLQYRCALPVNDETRQMLKAIYTGLRSELSDDEVEFDSTVRNPSRILRLYGTLNRKGRHTAERPWRMTSCKMPRDWRQVRTQQIEQLAELYVKKQPEKTSVSADRNFIGSGDYVSLDIVSWFKALGLYEHHIDNNIHSVVCPWEHEHSCKTFNDTVIFESDGGWPGFHCKHSHCDGRNIKDVLKHYGNADQFCARAVA